MLKTLVWLAVAVIGVFVIYFAALSVLSHRERQSAGLLDGKLRPCPDTPNCVSSEAPRNSVSLIKPIGFAGDSGAAWNAFTRTVTESGGNIKQLTANYLWAIFETPLFRFVDDVEARLDAQAGIIHIRSASRVGRSDFGANRQRIETIRHRFSALNG